MYLLLSPLLLALKVLIFTGKVGRYYKVVVVRFSTRLQWYKLYFKFITCCKFTFCFTEPAPAFTSEPSSNDSSIVEGNDLTLNWAYNIDGTLDSATFIDLRGGGTVNIIQQDHRGLYVRPSYANRTQVNKITNSETSITLLKVQRSDSGKYQLELENTARDRVESDVEIRVWRKYE